MNVTINGKPHNIAAAITVSQLITRLQLHERKLAVEINCKIVPSAEYPNTYLCEGDTIEIIEAIGGG